MTTLDQPAQKHVIPSCRGIPERQRRLNHHQNDAHNFLRKFACCPFKLDMTTAAKPLVNHARIGGHQPARSVQSTPPFAPTYLHSLSLAIRCRNATPHHRTASDSHASASTARPDRPRQSDQIEATR